MIEGFASVLGIILAIGGSVLGLIGAWGTSSADLKMRHLGFTCWVINNPALVLSMIGIALGWWKGITIIPLIVLNLIYWGTAARGFLNTRGASND